MTLPNAATQLIRQVQTHNADAEYHTVGDPDGFDSYRTIQFDSDTSTWLAPIMEVLLEHDDRIAEIAQKNGALKVTFVPDIRADFGDPFEIEAIEEVFAEEEPAKKPAKKASKKTAKR